MVVQVGHMAKVVGIQGLAKEVHIQEVEVGHRGLDWVVGGVLGRFLA